MSWRPASLVGRVALTGALACAITGAAAALATGVLADRLARAQEDERLRDAAETLALELRAPGADAVAVADDEMRELAHTGMLLTVFRASRVLAGDPALHAMSPGTCDQQGALRGCAVAAGSLVAVVARDAARLHDQRDATLFAAAVAVLVSVLVGTLLALGIAWVVVRPLWRLRDAVDRVPEHDPRAADLGPNENVAEVDALRTSLSSAFTRLGDALAHSQRFAADAAHQLRTPLTAMLGELELAAEQLTPNQSDGIARARKVAQRLAVLVDRLLILARTESALAVVEEVDLLEVVDDALAMQPAELRERIVVRGESTVVHADSALLIAMLGSALENALKFSAGTVRVELARRPGGALLAVEDSGPGIPEDDRERVFQPFYRVPGEVTARVPGHGLGLALIAHVAALHGGAARFAQGAEGARLEIQLVSS